MSDQIEVPQDFARTIVSPRSYAHPAALHETFRWLRANDPVALVEAEKFDPFWAVTKHADIMQVGRDKALFHNGDRPDHPGRQGRRPARA